MPLSRARTLCRGYPTAVLVGTMRGGDGRVSDSCLTVITEVLADPCAAAAVS
jgi:hypothetical protein